MKEEKNVCFQSIVLKKNTRLSKKKKEKKKTLFTSMRKQSEIKYQG